MKDQTHLLSTCYYGCIFNQQLLKWTCKPYTNIADATNYTHETDKQTTIIPISCICTKFPNFIQALNITHKVKYNMDVINK